MIKWLRKQRHIAQTRHELSRLTDKELNDIGIGRGDIERIARSL